MYDLLCQPTQKSKGISKSINNEEEGLEVSSKFYNGQELYICFLKSNKFIIMNNDFDVISEYSPFNNICTCNNNTVVSELTNFEVLENNRIGFTISNNLVIYDVIDKSESHYVLKNYKSIKKILVCSSLICFSEILNNSNINNNNKNKQKQTQSSSPYYQLSPTDSVILACINNRNKAEFLIYSLSNKSKVQISPEFAENWDENVFSLKNKYLVFTEKHNIVNLIDLTKVKSDTPFELVVKHRIIDVHVEVLNINNNKNNTFDVKEKMPNAILSKILVFVYSSNNIVKTYSINGLKEKLITNTALTKIEKFVDPINNNSDEFPKSLYKGIFLYNFNNSIFRLNFFSNKKKLVVTYCNLLNNAVSKSTQHSDLFNFSTGFSAVNRDENLSSISSLDSKNDKNNNFQVLQKIKNVYSKSKYHQYLIFIENTLKILLINSTKRNFSISVFK